MVHHQGFPETIVGDLTVPRISGRPLAGDDAEGTAQPVNTALIPTQAAAAKSAAGQQRFLLPDGYTMVWNLPGTLAPRTPIDFQFSLLDPHGQPPADMALYMGMLGHAAFVKTDGTVFAHIHPTGTMAMAAFMMANPQPANPSGGAMNMHRNTAGMNMPQEPCLTAAFPYGFPPPAPTASSFR